MDTHESSETYPEGVGGGFTNSPLVSYTRMSPYKNSPRNQPITKIIISLLSFFVLMLSIYLLLQKNTKKLQDLLLLGYSPAQVSRTYISMVAAINAGVLVISVIIMLVARSCYLPTLKALGTNGGTIVIALAVAVIIMALITAGNIVAIKRKINALWIHNA